MLLNATLYISQTTSELIMNRFHLFKSSSYTTSIQTAMNNNNRRLKKAIRKFQEAFFPDYVPNKTRRARFGVDDRQQQRHDEVVVVEDEDVSIGDNDPDLVDEGPPCSGQNRKQRDLTDWGCKDADARKKKKNRTGKQASNLRPVSTFTCVPRKTKKRTPAPKANPYEEDDEEVEIQPTASP